MTKTYATPIERSGLWLGHRIPHFLHLTIDGPTDQRYGVGVASSLADLKELPNAQLVGPGRVQVPIYRPHRAIVNAQPAEQYALFSSPTWRTMAAFMAGHQIRFPEGLMHTADQMYADFPDARVALAGGNRIQEVDQVVMAAAALRLACEHELPRQA